MEIIISGYGRMGKEVEKICIARNHKIIARIDNESDWQQLSEINRLSDVVIDFSMPDVAVNNYLRCFELGLPIVTGTTGWYDQLEFINEQCANQNGTFFYAPNFSIGVNILFKTNSYLAKLMSGMNDYKVKINETHHIHKLDAPSGTAISTAEGIIKEHKTLSEWALGNDNSNNILPIYSTREGEITGIHEVIYESGIDKIILKHEAKNRDGFALGAVLAAEYICGKKGVFNMDDLIKQML